MARCLCGGGKAAKHIMTYSAYALAYGWKDLAKSLGISLNTLQTDRHSITLANDADTDHRVRHDISHLR